MLEADITTWINTILFPFMPVITVFIASAIIYPGMMMMGAVRLLLFTLMLLKERREYK